LHEKGIKCILGVLGNLNKKSAIKGNELYLDFNIRSVDILAI
jgi:glycerophosphoryl diester phosphodiesterase